MSLDATLARVQQLDALFHPQLAQAAVQPVASSSSASGAGSTTFAGMLHGVMQPQPATDQGSGAANAIVQIAESQVGQAEQPPGSNDSPAIATYRTATQGAVAGAPWCAYFASWVAQQAGTPIGSTGQGLGYVGDIWNWARQTGRAIPNGPGVTPQVGDLIVFGNHHVGVVEQVQPNGDVQTIEGNYSNQVSRVVRGPGEASGYVRLG